MSFGNVIYTIIIYPLEFLFEIVFYLANRLTANPGLSIIVLSLTVNFFVLPLYIRADALQKEEKEIEDRLSFRVKRIKEAFKGDERFMMLQTYYRLNDYKTAYVFRSTLPLMLQIPFFIAAFRFLSNLKLLQGFSFGPITDLGTPDGMITIAGTAVNVLPVLMTLINIISGTIYSKGSSVKDKVQLYGIALIFLLLLYRSPAGLVFYWTLNNLFSLIKNIFYKLKRPAMVLGWISFACGIILMVYVLPKNIYSMRQKSFVAALGTALLLPTISRYLPRIRIKVDNISNKKTEVIYWLSILLISLTIGGLIPSTLVSSSTQDFIDVSIMNDPAQYVIYSMCISFGLFVIWMGIYYLLMGCKERIIFSYIAWTASIVFILDYMFFGTELGIMSNRLIFDDEPAFSIQEIVINLIVIVIAVVVCIVLLKKSHRFVTTLLASGILITTGFITNNMVHIIREYNEIIRIVSASEGEPEFSLSTRGKNVAVIMLDRYISYYIPYIFNEDPSLYDSFQGFTYYPNTVSFGIATNFGAPGLFGGYEYTPQKMNKRDDELLVDKHNEALKLMPAIFSDNGYNVTVVDVPYANYKQITDLSIYDEYPEVRKFLAAKRIGDVQTVESLDASGRKFFCYGVFKSAPVIVQPGIYNRGNYNSMEDKYQGNSDIDMMEGQVWDGIANAKGIDKDFVDDYGVLESFVDFTKIHDDDSDNFFMIDNETPHDAVLLSLPDYTPSAVVDNTAYGDSQFVKYDAYGNKIDLHEITNLKHYHVDMAAFRELAKWFDYLKEQGVYDNTRIIIVSDHGFKLKVNDDLMFKDKNGEEWNCMWLSSTLLEKDFNATGYTVNSEFMTNADVPTMAFENIIKDPINPFTGKRVNSDMKFNEKLELAFSHDWNVNENNGYRYKETDWLSVHDDIFKKENWEYLGRY